MGFGDKVKGLNVAACTFMSFLFSSSPRFCSVIPPTLNKKTLEAEPQLPGWNGHMR